MNSRGLTTLARCRLTPAASFGRPIPTPSTWSSIQDSIPHSGISAFRVKSSIRGAKTQAVLKAKDLPQGPLPPLPRDESDDGPTKTYSETLQQHRNNMRKYQDCVLFTRVGDFYELYFEHVEKYAPLLGLKQAKKRTTLGSIPMAGFQHWQVEKYLKILVQDHGLQVAIAEQIPIRVDDRVAKGTVMKFDRSVTRIVTKGTLIDEVFVDPFESNYLLAVHLDGPTSVFTTAAGSEAHEQFKRTSKVGLSWVDLSSGDFYVETSDLASLSSHVARIGPKEIVFDSSLQAAQKSALSKLLGEASYLLQFHDTPKVATSVAEWSPMLERPVPEEQMLEFTVQELAAGSLVLGYVRDRLQNTSLLLQPPVRRSDDEVMTIDRQSLRGLEIKSLLRDGSFKGSLLHAIRRTTTKSGARLLSQRIVAPSMSLSVINNRLDLVQQFLDHDALCEDVLALLGRTSDTCRLLQRFSINKGDADDLLGLARTIEAMSGMSEILHGHFSAIQGGESNVKTELGCLLDILDRLDLDRPSKVAKAILNAIDEEGLTIQHSIEAAGRAEAEEMTEEVVDADAAGEAPPRLARRASSPKIASTDSTEKRPEDIWIMRKTASSTLGRAHDDLERLLQAKQEMTVRLRGKLGTGTLTLQWSSKLGHYCHIRGRDIKADLAALQGVRSVSSTKSTRAFYLAEWTGLGVRIDDAKLRIRTEEERVLGRLRGQVIENITKLRRNAAVLDELDVACSSALVAKERNLIRPKLNNGTCHKIIGGRHPTVDIGLMEHGRPFTSNDCSVGDQEKIYLITGPNMAGKSTYLRQNALITILAQIGSFVPADYAEIGLVDKIFSRVGSADNLYQDQSTFMVEMLETAEILKQATPRSFVIMDEVGRGTTPEDGVAVGFACLHHIHHWNKCRTLFATHFHVLADMTKDFDDLRCCCTDIVEANDGSWAYVHKLREGVNRQSHALKVARLAGLPEEAISVAGNVLASFHGPSSSEELLERSRPVSLAATG